MGVLYNKIDAYLEKCRRANLTIIGGYRYNTRRRDGNFKLKVCW